MKHFARIVIATLALAVPLAIGVAAQRADTPEALLRAAADKAAVDGDLKGAIQEYQTIAERFKTNRPVVATALLRSAEAYQKLGDPRARTIYEQITRDFAEQTQVVAIARVRLNESGTGSSAMVARQLWRTTGYSQVTIANDGRTAAVVEPQSQDIQIRDLVKGQAVPFKVTADPSTGEYVEWPVLSPDLKSVAYAFAGPETKWNYQVRVSAVQPGAKPKALGETFPYVYVRGWAADGKSVLVTILAEGTSARIAWLSTIDSSVRTLKSLVWQGVGLIALSPDGRFIAYDVLVEPGKLEREIRILASDASTESIVVRGTGINAAPVWSTDGAHLVFTSNRSGTFGIWSVPIRNGRDDGPSTQLKADAGDVGLVGFTATGSLLYQQSIGKRDVFAVDLDSQGGALRGTSTRLVDTFVGSNVNPATSPDGKSVAYLSQRTQGLQGNWAQLIVRSLESGAERIIPTIFKGGGKPLWMPDGQSLIEVARNSQNHTTLYKVDLKSGDVAPVMTTGAAMPQSAALSPDGRMAYLGASRPDVSEGYQVAAYDLASGRRTDLRHAGTSRGVAASPDGRSIAFVASEDITPPFRVYIYVADADGGNPRTVLTSDKSGESPATMSVAWSSDSRFIYFLRRGTGSLWRVAVTGGSAMLVGELSKDVVGSIDISADGRRVIYGAGGQPTVEVWALENLLPVSAGRK